ncbi:FAD-binding oxidoreductase [Pseudoflavitalea sp. X16]|uniref:NAD(P)/FAD-dependent oxidoreductase n=1 Tax=Paraflavitalea devenefica TaxID=2716334 RepID=UPI00141E15C4|nr:FAD-dependent oxidoreductase [Paraflavitalea devenefica]NII28252.1 FAD-binding oxidoreductase [Paraflavitalea devenefica]
MQISIWEKESFYAPKDVIIVGSGLVGLWSAYYLKKQNPRCSVAIVDRGVIPTGASTRNAGFACFGSVTELQEDFTKMGEDKTLELVSMRYQGLQRMRKILDEKLIDFELCGGYELIAADSDPGMEALEEQIATMNKKLKQAIKTSQTFKLSDKKISEFGFQHVAHLLENKLEGYLHSGKLCQALLQLVQSMGVIVFNGVEITHFEKIVDKMVLYTKQQLRFTASKILVCTNAFAKELLPALDIIPARGQVLVTSTIHGLKLNGTFHYDEGYYYFRNIGNRVLLGGARNKAFEEERTTEMNTTDTIQKELEHFLAHYILPGKEYAITDRWSGIMGMGSEKMPIMQEVSPQVYCAVRMSGMGVALAPVIGEKVAEMLKD